MLAKIAKLKKLLNIGDNHMLIAGLRVDNNANIEDIEIEDMKLNDDLEFLIRDNKKGVQKIDNFKVILARNNDGDTIEPPTPFFPSIPFAMYVLGVVKAGKSTLLSSILPLYIDAFDKTFFLSPTFNLDPEAITLLDSYPDIEAFGDINALDVIVRKMTKVNKGKDPKDKVKVLVIMDDMISDICKLGRKDSTFLTRIALNRRHVGISFIMLSQHFRKCPSMLRSNFSSFALFRMENQLEKKKVIEELSGFLGKKKFEELFNRATSDPYNFLSINYDASEKQYQYTKNFNEILVSEQDMNQTAQMFN